MLDVKCWPGEAHWLSPCILYSECLSSTLCSPGLPFRYGGSVAFLPATVGWDGEVPGWHKKGSSSERHCRDYKLAHKAVLLMCSARLISFQPEWRESMWTIFPGKWALHSPGVCIYIHSRKHRASISWIMFFRRAHTTLVVYDKSWVWGQSEGL